ncbi:MAG: ACT domain-containing protein [Clostridia bacterium]|nr:ACT domain-containing protein [Clostridia bacterium]
MTVKQISVFLENRKGQLNEITKILAQAGINLLALNIAETTEYGIVRIIVDDVAAATDALIGAGMVVKVSDVSRVTISNSVGGLNSALQKIADAGIDIEYMYSMVSGDSENADMVFKTADSAALEAALAN